VAENWFPYFIGDISFYREATHKTPPGWNFTSGFRVCPAERNKND
jgi:hypothetical protein